MVTAASHAEELLSVIRQHSGLLTLQAIQGLVCTIGTLQPNQRDFRFELQSTGVFSDELASELNSLLAKNLIKIHPENLKITFNANDGRSRSAKQDVAVIDANRCDLSLLGIVAYLSRTKTSLDKPIAYKDVIRIYPWADAEKVRNCISYFDELVQKPDARQASARSNQSRSASKPTSRELHAAGR